LEISSKFPIGVDTIYKAPNLVFLGIVSYFYKFLIISANLILFIGCSTNIPNNTFDSNKVIAIEKPEISYAPTKLPNSINVLLFDTEGLKEKEFISGLSVNYYYFKKQINYSPQISFLNIKEFNKNNCDLKQRYMTTLIVYLTDDLLGSLDDVCLNNILKLKTVLIDATTFSMTYRQSQVVLNLNKKQEYKSLLIHARNNGSNNVLIIDEQKTSDKTTISEIWRELDGNVLGSYTSSSKSSQNLLSIILLIESSKERSRKLSRALSTSLENFPRRRKDIDSIILSVSLEKARSLKPELEYNFGESLSVYLFPDWDNETFYLQKELDLEGIALIDLPWMLNSKATFIPELPTKRSRDFASGFDAYDIALLISNPSSSNYFKYIGMTGELIYRNGKLVRKSLKAEIKKGLFQMIGY